MSDIISIFKDYINKYLNTEYSIEILLGSIENSDIFRYKYSLKEYNKILQYFKKNYKYSHVKNFHYKIYTNKNKKLYINLMNPDSYTLLKQTLVKNNQIKTHPFDLKYKTYLKKNIQQSFESNFEYDNEIIRKTISFNIYNLLYINFSEVKSVDDNKYYSIKIIIPAKFHKTKEKLIQEYDKLIKFIKKIN